MAFECVDYTHDCIQKSINYIVCYIILYYNNI